MVRSVDDMNETTADTSPSITDTDRGRADAAGVLRSRRGRRLRRAATIAAATLSPLLVWVIAVPLAGLDLVAGAGATAQTVAPPAIVGATLVAGLAAWGVLALLERVSKRGRLIFTIVGWAFLALSLLGPVMTGTAGAVLVVLLVMHVATGSTLVIGLPRAARVQHRGNDGR